MTVAFDLAFDPVKQVAFELLHFAAAQTGHMHMRTLRPPLIEMSLAFDMQ